MMNRKPSFELQYADAFALFGVFKNLTGQSGKGDYDHVERRNLLCFKPADRRQSGGLA